jgi:Flp pilus assembly protein TadB
MTLLVAIATGIAMTSLVLAAGSDDRPAGMALLPAHLRLSALIDRARRRRDRARAAAGATVVLQGTHAALRSGLPIALALRASLESVDRDVREPFDRALRAFDLNAPLGDVLRAAAAEARDRRLTLALEALALVASEQLPATRAAAIVASVADRLAFEERLLTEIRARSSGLRGQIVLLALLVPTLALYLVLTLPGLAATLATPLGAHVLVPMAILLELSGIIASRAIVRGVAV